MAAIALGLVMVGGIGVVAAIAAVVLYARRWRG
jgi:hypothetical protein